MRAMNQIFLFGKVVTLGVFALMLGCVAAETGVAQPSARRSNVLPPSLGLAPASIILASGQNMVFTARPAGGEAMLFSVDWALQEGEAGGIVVGGDQRQPDGSFVATYTAPAAGAGHVYHLTATLHEYPAARAVATIEVTM
jgi:hypothetical protein